MKHTDRSTRVEVVIHAIQEPAPKANDLIPIGACPPGRVKLCASTPRHFDSVEAVAARPLIEFEKTVETSKALLQFVKPLFAVLNRASIVCAKQQKPQRLRRVPF